MKLPFVAEQAFYSIPKQYEKETVICFFENLYYKKDGSVMNEEEFKNWAETELSQNRTFYITRKLKQNNPLITIFGENKKMNIKITRRSKVGFGYNSSCEQVWNNSMTQSWLQPMKTNKPDHVGTILQVEKSIEKDSTLRSFKSGGTYYSSSWFVKVDGKWHKIVDDEENMYNFAQLTSEEDSYSGKNYRCDFVVVEVE